MVSYGRNLISRVFRKTLIWGFEAIMISPGDALSKFSEHEVHSRKSYSRHQRICFASGDEGRKHIALWLPPFQLPRVIVSESGQAKWLNPDSTVQTMSSWALVMVATRNIFLYCCVVHNPLPHKGEGQMKKGQIRVQLPGNFKFTTDLVLCSIPFKFLLKPQVWRQRSKERSEKPRKRYISR